MSIHITAQLVYVHFLDRFGIHLFDLHLKKVLPGFPISEEYVLHGDHMVDREKNSINLAITMDGKPVDTDALAEHLTRLHIFGPVAVGCYSIVEIPMSQAEAA